MNSPIRIGMGHEAMGIPGGMGRRVTRGMVEEGYHGI
jgi:hypothetical protein